MKSSQDFTEDDYDVQFETDVSYITDYFDAVEAFNESGIIACNGDMIFTKVQDPANVALTVSKIESEGFNSIDKTVEGTSKVALEFERILDFFSGVSKKSSTVLTYPVEKDSMGGKQFIHIDVIDEDVQFYCPMIDLGSVADIPQMDPIQCAVQVDVPGSDLKKAIKHCEKVETDGNKAIDFQTENDRLVLKSEDKTYGSVEKQFHATGPSDDIDLGNKSTQISMDYLKDIKNIISSAEDVTVHLDDEHPVRLDVPIDDNGNAKIIYVIAPRIQSD